jgi:hypothetical protein
MKQKKGAFIYGDEFTDVSIIFTNGNDFDDVYSEMPGQVL